MQLEKNPTSFESALKNIPEDIRINKKKQHISHHLSYNSEENQNPNGRLMSEKLKAKLNVGSKNLERDVLTAEQRRENCDSRTRVKIVK